MKNSSNLKPLYLSIIGISGGGKGTQAELISQEYGIKHISMGDLFRQEIKNETPIGLRVKEIVNQGKWVPTELTLAVLRPVLVSNLKKGFILDGFPRLSDQPAALSKILQQEGIGELDAIIHLLVSPEVVWERRKSLGSQFQSQERRDNNSQAIRNKISEYQNNIEFITDYYCSRKILFEVNGERPIEPIFEDIKAILDNLPKSKGG